MISLILSVWKEHHQKGTTIFKNMKFPTAQEECSENAKIVGDDLAQVFTSSFMTSIFH
jgi:hypothetical protein